MSGTSGDGIDAALIRTDGEKVDAFGPWQTYPFDAEMRQRLPEAMQLAARLGRDAASDERIATLARDLTLLHADAVKHLMAEANLSAPEIRIVGFHGQTLVHRPEARFTVQIGDGELLARLLDMDVIHDFRSADVAAGGQGAPFAPLYHRALVRGLGAAGPVAVVNIGGVANLTWIDDRLDEMIAFDTGPGNGLIDDWCRQRAGQPCDHDGALARAGRVDPPALTELLRAPQLHQPPPRSLDRHDFNPAPVAHLSTEDGAATLAAFTAASIRMSVAALPQPPVRWIVCGGGRHNPVLMDLLARELSVPVAAAEAAGWRGDALEAEAFAYLAVRSLRGLPLSLPATTGVPAPQTGGRLARASSG